jgi:6,7-dimethyl-8-ribityllumazine synthase
MADVSNSKLYTIDTGILNKDARIVIVRTDWNASILDQLEEGCTAYLNEQGFKNYQVISVPGAFEIPFAIKNHWEKSSNASKPVAYIALGCIIQGDTPHFDYVCKAVTDGVVHLNLKLPVPTIFGVLTVLTEEQAIERVGGKHGHKGTEAAITALKMAALAQSKA